MSEEDAWQETSGYFNDFQSCQLAQEMGKGEGTQLSSFHILERISE